MQHLNAALINFKLRQQATVRNGFPVTLAWYVESVVSLGGRRRDR